MKFALSAPSGSARIKGGLLAAAAVAVVSIGGASPAQAAPTGTEAAAVVVPMDSADCPANRFCVWTNATYSGRFAYFSGGSANLANPIGGYVFNNKISSIWNRTSRAWCMYNGADYTGRSFRQTAGGFRANLAIDGFNDLATSLRPC